MANIEKNCKLSESLYTSKKRNTLVYNDKSYVINAYPVNLVGADGYIQFADLVNKRDEIKYLYDLLSIYSSIDTSIPQKVIFVNKQKITSFDKSKKQALAKLEKLRINTKDIRKKINEICDSMKNEKEKLQTMKNELKDFKSNNIKQHYEMEVLDFIKTLFKYLQFFAPEAVPNIDNVNNLKELPQKGTYSVVFSNISDIDNINVKEIFTRYKEKINKYLHAEYMLYYDLTKSNQLITWPIYFGSYKEMCSDCQELWAKHVPFKKGQYNVIYFFKKKMKIMKIKLINLVCSFINNEYKPIRMEIILHCFNKRFFKGCKLLENCNRA